MKYVRKRFWAADIAIDDPIDRLITLTFSNEYIDTASDCDETTDIEKTYIAIEGYEESWNLIVMSWCRLQIEVDRKRNK